MTIGAGARWNPDPVGREGQARLRGWHHRTAMATEVPAMAKAYWINTFRSVRDESAAYQRDLRIVEAAA